METKTGTITTGRYTNAFKGAGYKNRSIDIECEGMSILASQNQSDESIEFSVFVDDDAELSRASQIFGETLTFTFGETTLFISPEQLDAMVAHRGDKNEEVYYSPNRYGAV